MMTVEEKKAKACEKSRLWRLANPNSAREYEKRNKDRRQKYRRNRYRKDAVKFREEAKTYREANRAKHLDSVKASHETSERYLLTLFRKHYYASEEYKRDRAESNAKHALTWVDENRGRHAASCKKWAERNRGRINSYASSRRAAKEQARPQWASQKDIEAVYAEARRLTEKTGVSMHVDHIWPLRPRSKRFVGLHVPWNLQIITASENSRKSDKVPS